MKGFEVIEGILGGGRRGVAEVRVEESEGLFSYYVRGRCDGGFDPDEAILLRPLLKSTEAEYVAIQNHSAYWCRPFFGTDLSDLPERVQGLLIRGSDRWQYFMPVCDRTFKTVLRGWKGGLEAVTYANCEGLTVCEDQLAMVAGEGSDPLALVHRVAREATRRLGVGGLREDRGYPEIFEYLGWCSWDSFGIRVSHEGLLAKAREFREKNVPVRFAILDDMWADVPDLKRIPDDADFRTMVKGMHESRLRTFEGDPDRFPKGIGAAVADLKEAGIDHVGIWFPTTGYWKGWEPEGEAKEMDGLLTTVLEDRLIPKPEERAAEAYLDRLCGKVKEWGGDFVKIDNQGFLSKHYRNAAPIGEAAHALQAGIDRAALRYFDGALINCMGMPSECTFHRPTSAVSRCSDDFIPESPAWFAKNILQCSYNGLLQGQIYVNDWDMWWTDDAQALKNSICRAVSGGPVYVSDKPGRTRPEVLRPLCFADGRIPRCDGSATPTADCLVSDPTRSGRIFKIFNRVGESRVLAVYDLDEENRAVTGEIGPADVGLSSDCVFYEHFTATAVILGARERMPLTLGGREELRLYTVVPLADEGVTLLGRADQFVGMAAVTEWDGTRLRLYEGGPFAFLSEKEVRVFSESRELPVERKGSLCRVIAEKEETLLRFETV